MIQEWDFDGILMKTYVKIALRTRVETKPLEVGRALLDVLSLGDGQLYPEQVSHNPDRFKDAFSGPDTLDVWWNEVAQIRVEGAISDFSLDFAWRRKAAVKSNGYVCHTTRNNRGAVLPGTVNITCQWSSKVERFEVFRALIDVFPPRLAMLHLFTAPEIGRPSPWSSFEAGSFGAALNPDIANIAWAMYYGDEFSNEGDRQGMRERGFFVDERLNGYLVTVTEKLEDVRNNFNGFSLRRAELKSLYRPGRFRIGEEPAPKPLVA